MANFGRDDRRGGGGRGDFGKRSFGDRYQNREMHKAICSKCQKECEVPFRPTGGKPVFCRDCFKNNGGSDFRRPMGENFSRPSFSSRNEDRDRKIEGPQYQQQFEALNIKLDKILKILTPVIVKEEAPAVKAQEQMMKEPEARPSSGEKIIVIPEKKKRVSKKVLQTTS